MKKFFIVLTTTAFIMACNSSGENKTENKDTMTHDMHMGDSTASMPAMPEIPTDAKVYFANLKDGQTVKSPVKVEMAVTGLSVDTANGKLKPASGHHHILIDIDSIPANTVVVKDSVHLHFGNAQTSAEVKLSPGKHTLTLQFADALHRSYGSRLTSKVTLNVKE
jgi:hypothetical protein